MGHVIGVDVAGTFTCAVLDDAGTVLAAMAPSTPPNYLRGVLDVLPTPNVGDLDKMRLRADITAKANRGQQYATR